MILLLLQSRYHFSISRCMFEYTLMYLILESLFRFAEFIQGRVQLLSAAGIKKVFLLFRSGEWRVMCYQKHLETVTS